MTADTREWLSTSDVAPLIGRSEDAVRELAEQGKFRGAYRLGPGSHWRIPSDGVAAFLEEQARRIGPVIRRSPK